MFYHMFRPFVSAIMADPKRPKHDQHKRPKYVVEHRCMHGVLSVVFVLVAEQMLIGKHCRMIPKLTALCFYVAVNLWYNTI
jgi:hypothetical protein